METNDALRALAALSQVHRLEAFRLLVRSGHDGMPAGAIARHLAVPHNTLSSHLGILVNAGLLVPERAGRSIIYRVNFEGTRRLLGFLMEDCCRGNPKVCAPVLDNLLPGCCPQTHAALGTSR